MIICVLLVYGWRSCASSFSLSRARNLKKAWGSPNGAMRAGWNGISISRDTIHLPGMQMGYKRPVLFDRHAVGGEYGAGYKIVGPGTMKD